MSTDNMYWAVNGSQSKVQRGQQHFGIQCLDNNSWFPNPGRLLLLRDSRLRKALAALCVTPAPSLFTRCYLLANVFMPLTWRARCGVEVLGESALHHNLEQPLLSVRNRIRQAALAVIR